MSRRVIHRQQLLAVYRLAALGLMLMSATLIAHPLVARAQSASGTPQTVRFTVSGIVLDPSNLAIVGAEVTLFTANRDSQITTMTGSQGDFRFEGVTTGNYELEVRQERFRVYTIPLKVGPRAPGPQRVVLALSNLNQQITVSVPDSQVSDNASENADAVVLDTGALQSLPAMGHDVVGALTQLMGNSAFGDTTLIVDGVTSSDLDVPVSSIQEVRINDNPYAAEFSSPGQSRVDVITKTGSAKYHGSFDTAFRDYHLDARNAFSPSRPVEHHLYLDGSLSGPLGKSGKTTFLISGERDQDNTQAVVDALTPTGAIHQNFPTPERNTLANGRITRQFGQNNVFSVRYNYYQYSTVGEGVGDLTLPEAGYNETTTRHYLLVSDRAILTNTLVNELSVRATASSNAAISLTPGQPSISVLGAFTGGGAQQSLAEKRNYLQLTDMLSWSRGRHTFKIGASLPSLSRYSENNENNSGGGFQFSTLQDYLNGTPFSFTEQQGNGRLVYWYTEIGFFAQDEIRVRPGLSIALGLRYDRQSRVSNPDSFAPRLSFAYSPGKSRNVVFRGGAGMFYQTTGSSAVADILMFNGQHLHKVVISDPGYPDAFSGGGSAQIRPGSLVEFAPDIRLPYVIQYSFGVEVQLSKSTTFSETYLGMRGVHLYMSRDINAPLAPLYQVRPDPSIGMLQQIESSGSLKSNAMKISLNSKINRFFSAKVQYTLSRSYDNTGGLSWFPANQYNPTGEWARSNRDSLHAGSVYGTFKAGKLFEFGAVLTGRSGRPYTITTGTDLFGTTFGNARPAGVPRNSMQGPDTVNLDVRWSKDFSLFAHRSGSDSGEGLAATISADAFNVLNTVNFGQPVGNISSPLFGQSVSASSPRRIQISLGLEF